MVLSDLLSFVGKSTLHSFLHRTHVADFEDIDFPQFVRPILQEHMELQISVRVGKEFLGGGFKHVYFHPHLGKIPIFQMGWNHQLDSMQISFPDKVFIN